MKPATKFQPSPIGTLIFLISFVIFCYLAYWQQNRVEEKTELALHYQTLKTAKPFDLNHTQSVSGIPLNVRQPVSAVGTYLASEQFLLDSQVYKGKPGYHVITPLKILGQDFIVLVNRGWVSAGGNRLILPEISIPTQELNIRGHFAKPKQVLKSFQQDDLSNKSQTRLAIDIQQISDSMGAPVLPLIIHLQNESGDPLKRDWPEYNAKVEMHEFYVIHWLAVAAASIGIYLYYSFKPKTK